MANRNGVQVMTELMTESPRPYGGPTWGNIDDFDKKADLGKIIFDRWFGSLSLRDHEAVLMFLHRQSAA